MRIQSCVQLLVIVSQILCAGSCRATDEADTQIWETAVEQFFPGEQVLVESTDVIELHAPARAEDPAITPIRVVARFDQSESRYIQRILLLIDKNPQIFTGLFEFGPASARADISTRVRVNSYSHIRAIAELNDGSLSMHKVFVKASGGCSAPVTPSDTSKEKHGQIRLKPGFRPQAGDALPIRVAIRHSNITGLQMDQSTRGFPPAHYIDSLQLNYQGKLLVRATTGIAISTNPAFEFVMRAQADEPVEAVLTDNRGERFVAVTRLFD